MIKVDTDVLRELAGTLRVLANGGTQHAHNIEAAADTIDRLRGENGHPSIKLHQCPTCNEAATAGSWDAATRTMYGSGSVKIDNPDVIVAETYFVCPNVECGVEATLNQIKTMTVGVERT
ncbi:hypothetical protein CIG75_19215 [Tumebacillus algifaecis]|uniref:Uncharacterized protein n=1 Tax=Tumebacillus algifaecis TaxID=1214604 RepID=A0A223D663_9BACL|nr:hypothetical protein [Tumebacillus algifaecis]ASS76864.1 hypothetical protein CIG75_19215 [Tumebacillus algifaecis]